MVYVMSVHSPDEWAALRGQVAVARAQAREHKDAFLAMREENGILRNQLRGAVDLPWSVGVTETCTLIARFDTHDHAAEFIGLLPDHERGIYYLDGPERGQS